MAYWLMKSEPTTFSFDDLMRSPGQTTAWEGVRNYQARNLQRDEIKCGDQVFFYHSSCAEPAVVGLAEIVREGYPDHHAWDPASRYYDAASPPEKPRWYMVDLRFVRRLARPVSLAELRAAPALTGLALLRRGNRLSVLPVSEAEAAVILAIEAR